MPDGYILSERDHAWLHEFKRRGPYDLSEKPKPTPPPKPPLVFRVGKIYDADIAPGAFTGEAKFWTWNGSAFEETDDDPVDVYDFMGSGIPENMLVHLHRLAIFENALWVANWPMRLLGKLEGTLSQGGSATVGVWAWNGSSYADTGTNITAYDWLMKSGATAIASGKKVVIEFFADSQRWFVTEAECA